MKVALPIWNNRLSPVLDTAGRMLVVEFKEGEEIDRREYSFTDIYPPLRVRLLRELGVDVLICGAVSNPVSYLIGSAGIRMIPWVSGEIEDILGAYRRGELEDPRYLMPGCRGKGRRFRMGRGGRRGTPDFGPGGGGFGRGYGSGRRMGRGEGRMIPGMGGIPDPFRKKGSSGNERRKGAGKKANESKDEKK